MATKRYAIWDKQTTIITPIFEVLTPAQWIERYPVAGVDSITVVCSAGEINGGFFGTLNQMVQMYTNAGCDFSACTTDEEKLEAIEAFEDEQNNASTNSVSAEERIAAALEYQVLASLPNEDTEEDTTSAE